MSKKTRKKSSSTTAKRAPAKAATAVKTSVKKSAAQTRSTKPPGKVGKTAPTKASHKAPSKGLKTKAAAPKVASPTKAASGLAEGAKAPAFTLPRDGGSSVSLADFAGQKLVLFFYPRADTPGCTKEAIDFTRLKGDFAAAGAAVLGISADTVKAQESFRNKHQLSVPLISDEAHEMLESYGAWGEKSMYGRTFLGIIRTTVLVDDAGKIAKIWRNVRVDGHADEVLAAARSL